MKLIAFSPGLTLKFLCISLTLIGLLGCSAASDKSLLSDGSNNSACSSGGCADATAKITDTKISINTATRYLDPGVPFVELQGECSASTYPDNYINLTFKRDGVVASPTPVVKAMTKSIGNANLPSCVNGKFYFIIQVANTGSYTVTGQLVAKNGLIETPSPTAKFTVPFVRAQ